MLLAPPVFGDVQCDGVDDTLTSGQSLSAFFSASTWTLTTFLHSTGTPFANDLCWPDGPALQDTNQVLTLGRTGTTGSGSACIYVHDGVTIHRLLSPISGGWHHLAARLDGGTLTLFTDGIARDSVSGVGTMDTTGLLQLCGTTDGWSPDRLTNVQLFDTALSDGAIERLARGQQQQIAPEAPTAYWPLTDCPDGASGGGSVFRDRSGYNRPLSGNVGANGTGLTCQAMSLLNRPGGIQ